MKRFFVLSVVLTGLLFFLSLCRKADKGQERKYYLFDFCNGIFNYSKDTLSEITNDNKYIEIKFKSENGISRFRVRQRDSAGNFINKIEGSYTANPIKYDTVLIGVFFGKPEKVVYKTIYYKPLRDGVWNYYDSGGKLIKSEKYSNGELAN